MSAAPAELLPPLLPRFVGREQEFLLLRWQLSDARQGRGSVVVVKGEAGLGKTRLLEELAPVARAQEFLFLTGTGTAARTEVAYGLIAALLEDYLGNAAGTGERAELRDIVAELAPHLWQTIFPDEEAPVVPGQRPPEVQEGLFQARIISLLVKRAEARPIVLCLEDLHWADAASRQLLDQLAGRIAQSPILMVRTLRPEEESDDLRRAQQELGRQEHVHFIELLPLSADESRELVSSCFPREGFTSELFEALHQRSRGVPFFLIQCLESLRQESVLYEDRGLWVNRGLRESDMPESVREAILRRIDGLSPEDRDLLSFAAVQGSVFEGLLLSRLISESPRQVLRRLSELMRRTRLIRTEGRKFCFGHPVLAETFYQLLPEAQRRHVHLRLAFIVKSLRPDDSETLAYHFYRGGLLDQALPELIASAHRACAADACREARRYLTQALEACDQVDGADSERAEVLLLLAETEQRLGDPLRALELCRQLLSDSGRHADPKTVASTWLQMGWAHFRRSDLKEAKSCCAGALERFAALGDEESCALVEMRLGHIAFELSDLDTAFQRYRHAREGVSQIGGSPTLLAGIDLCLGVVASVRGQHEAAILSYTSALKAYRGIRHRYGICQTFHNLGMTHAAAADWRAAIQCYESATELARKLGVVDVLANILVSRAVAEVRGGDLDQADLFCRQSAVLMEQLGDRLGLAECRKVEGIICAARRQYERAGVNLMQGRNSFEELENLLGVAECERELGLLQRTQGDEEGTRQHLGESLRLFGSIGAHEDAHTVEELLSDLSAGSTAGVGVDV